MKLWLDGGQTDEYIECEPTGLSISCGGSKCDQCDLRFKCFTSKALYFKDLTHEEATTFLKMCNVQKGK